MFGVIAVAIVVVGFKPTQVYETVKDADPYMIALSFVFSLVTFYATALSLVAFTPEKIRVWDTSVMFLASSLVSVVAPAGLGVFAVNVKFLKKHGIATSKAVATVTLLQLSQFLTTATVVVVMAVISHTKAQVPISTTKLFLGFALVCALGAIVYAIAPLRKWFALKVSPYFELALPRFMWLIKNPKKLVIGLLGNVLFTLSYALCFYFALCAFDTSFSFPLVAVAFSTAWQVGSFAPTPGAIGAMELALSGALHLIGVSTAYALSTAVLYRLISFWIRIPAGWLALHYCQKKNLL